MPKLTLFGKCIIALVLILIAIVMIISIFPEYTHEIRVILREAIRFLF